MRTIEKTLQNVGRAFLQFGQDFRQKDLGVALRRLYDDVRNPPTGPPPIPQQPGWIMNLGGGDLWTKEHAFEGTQIFGATGSGKTTGSGQKIAIGLLKAGFGGLVLTAKDEEVTTWRAYMEAAKRPSEDLCIFN